MGASRKEYYVDRKQRGVCVNHPAVKAVAGKVKCQACYDKEFKDRKLNPAHKLFIDAKFRATKHGLAFNITEEDIFIPNFCPVLGIPLKPTVGRCSANSPTVDRIDSSKGYVRGNVCVISFRANTIKPDATAEELDAVARYVRTSSKQFEIELAVKHGTGETGAQFQERCARIALVRYWNDKTSADLIGI